MKDRDTYRVNLERIKEELGQGELITIRKAASYLGLDVRTLKKTAPIRRIGTRDYITASDLARWLS